MASDGAITRGALSPRKTNVTQTADTRRLQGGFLIAFEGVDGSGKTTQARRVTNLLDASGYDAVYLREPSDGPVGQHIRSIMVAGRDKVTPDEEFRLFLDDRTDDVKTNINPALRRGAVVCIDRYYISSMAYQGALGLDPQFIRSENEKIAPLPDLVLYFRLDVEAAGARITAARTAGQNLFEARAYQEAVATQFETMNFPGMVALDASAPPDVLTEEIMTIIRPLLTERTL
jgi:dTMP kinase